MAAEKAQAETHDRPLGGDSEIVRGRKSQKGLGEDSHQVMKVYRRAAAKVKQRQRDVTWRNAGPSCM